MCRFSFQEHEPIYLKFVTFQCFHIDKNNIKRFLSSVYFYVLADSTARCSRYDVISHRKCFHLVSEHEASAGACAAAFHQFLSYSTRCVSAVRSAILSSYCCQSVLPSVCYDVYCGPRNAHALQTVYTSSFARKVSNAVRSVILATAAHFVFLRFRLVVKVVYKTPIRDTILTSSFRPVSLIGHVKLIYLQLFMITDCLSVCLSQTVRMHVSPGFE